MRIAFIVGGFPALSETFILNQVTGLIDMGHDVEIFAHRNPKEAKVHPDIDNYRLLERTSYFDMPDGRVERVLKALCLIARELPRHPGAVLSSLNVLRYGKDALSLYLLYALVPLLGKSFDILHCHFGPLGVLGIRLRRMGVGGKVVTTFHGFDMTSYLQSHGDGVYDELFAKGDMFLPISNRWKEKLVGLGCDERKVMVHRMGVDTDKFAYRAPRDKRGGKIRLLTIARLAEKKGVRYGIEAVARLVDKYPSVEYTVIGDGPLRGELEALASGLGVSNMVRFAGPMSQEEVKARMLESDVMVAPSVTSAEGDQEGIPVAIMEAMAVGLPVISTLHSGIPELVEDGVSGFLVPERDSGALLERLVSLVKDSELRESMGVAGRRRIEEHFDVNKLNRRLEEKFRSLLVAPGGRPL